MREIKFRVWAEGKLYSPPKYFLEIEFWEHGSIAVWVDNRMIGGKTDLVDCFHPNEDEVELLQFTGLKDNMTQC